MRVPRLASQPVASCAFPHESIDRRARGLPTCRQHRARRVRNGHVDRVDLLEPRGLQRVRHVVHHGKHLDRGWRLPSARACAER